MKLAIPAWLTWPLAVTEAGFLAYWGLTFAGVISVGDDPFLQQWNYSFLGLDLTAIALGLAGVTLRRWRRRPVLDLLIVVSLTLTAVAGLMALNFYLVRRDFDPAWWLPNGWLLAFGAAGLIAIGRASPPAGVARDTPLSS
jgi:hypothetical protein